MTPNISHISFNADPVWNNICLTIETSICSEFMEQGAGYGASNCKKCRQKWFAENTNLTYNTTLSDNHEIVVQGNEDDVILFVLKHV